jgi:hypothetical protein
MNKHMLCQIALILAFVMHYTVGSARPTLLTGSIQFPFTLSHIPNIAMYSEGKRLTTEMNDDEKKIHFTIAKANQQRDCYLVVTTHLGHAQKDKTSPTYDYQKIDLSQPYKCYKLNFVVEEPDENDAQQKPLYRWIVEQQDLQSVNGRIPDNAIIVYYDPQLIDTVEGGNALELPTIKLKPDLLALLGSETDLHDFSDKLWCASVDLRHIHSSVEHNIKRDTNLKTILVLST